MKNSVTGVVNVCSSLIKQIAGKTFLFRLTNFTDASTLVQLNSSLVIV